MERIQTSITSSLLFHWLYLWAINNISHLRTVGHKITSILPLFQIYCAQSPPLDTWCYLRYISISSIILESVYNCVEKEKLPRKHYGLAPLQFICFADLWHHGNTQSPSTTYSILIKENEDAHMWETHHFIS